LPPFLDLDLLRRFLSSWSKARRPAADTKPSHPVGATSSETEPKKLPPLFPERERERERERLRPPDIVEDELEAIPDEGELEAIPDEGELEAIPDEDAGGSLASIAFILVMQEVGQGPFFITLRASSEVIILAPPLLLKRLLLEDLFDLPLLEFDGILYFMQI